MASAQREPITGVWGRAPSGGPGAEPPVRGGGVRGQSPLEAECLFVFACPKEAANFPHY